MTCLLYTSIGDIFEHIKESLQRVDSAEYIKFKVCDLYEVINEEDVFAMLHIDNKDVMEMLKPFAILMDECKTVISQNIWNCQVQKDSVLPLPKIAITIWTPVLTEILNLVEKLCNKSVTLMEIDHHLENIHNLEEEIRTLVKGYNMCLHKSMSTDWISKFVVDVQNYRDVCKAQVSAKLVLAAKNALMLEGKFEELEKFLVEVNFKYILNVIPNWAVTIILITNLHFFMYRYSVKVI